MLRSHRLLLLPLALSLPVGASCQHLTAQEPGRTVYKCVQGKKVTYTDDPCPAAVELDVTPTRGMDRSSGVERKGRDVQNEIRREQLAAVARPITGMSTEQFNTAVRRQRLLPQARSECARLDGQLKHWKQREQSAKPEGDLPEVQARLLALRKRYRELAC